MSIRVELFVKNLEDSKNFYEQLSFEIMNKKESIINLKHGDSTLLLTSKEILNDDHYFMRNNTQSQLGIGVEIILETDHVETLFKNMQYKNPQSIESKLKTQPWGMTDFRIIDPDGYYIRVTSK
ncbi:VOC family protein [Virgibacillus pantothenticus]|uniref:VOC family protein n=1 Tax=Virgibacillus pantothenticus TaxID=1473 RepID=UPI0009878E6D|nr:VOC family protein [Virgibacillus pantothenticus]